VLQQLLVVGLLISGACSSPPTLLPTEAVVGPPTPSRSARLNLDALHNIVFEAESEAASYIAGVDGQTVPEHSQLRTGAASSARLDFSDGSIVRMGPITLLVLDQLGGTDRDPFTRLKFSAGVLWVSLTGGQMALQTPLGLAGMRGSYAEFQYQPVTDSASNPDNVLTIRCIEGTCTFDSGHGLITLGNLQQLVVSHGGQTITGPSDLDASSVREFVANNPESTGVVPSLTAAAQSPSVTPAPTDTPGPSGTPAPTNTPGPADTPTETATAPTLDTPLPSDTAPPSPTRTRSPVVIVPTATPTDTPALTDTPLPPATDTPKPSPHPPPPHPPTATNPPPPAPSDTPVPPPTATNPPPATKTATRPPPPTKTASPVP
jgi:FecR protein